ncbi:MAG: hypothetical protein ACKO5E_21215 [bacterium]
MAMIMVLALLLSAGEVTQRFSLADDPGVSAKNSVKENVVTGKVVALNEKNDKVGQMVVVLKSENGQGIVLENDDGARLFFLDPAVRNRRARLRLQYQDGNPKPATINVEIENEGRWRVPQYYCDVCTIAVRYPQICLCCQGPMEFRFKPER